MATVTTTIGTRQDGVGLQSSSTYYKYVLPSWWRRLFYGDGGLVDFLSNENVVGVSYVNSDVRLSYPDLVERLERYGYSYRLPKRWRKKVPRDWRRRSGVITVNVVVGVECLVKLDRGYARRIQVIGSVRGFSELGRVAKFLRRVFGVRVDIKELVSIPGISRPDPNRLKSISWGVVRKSKEVWVPVTGFGRWLSDKIVEKLEEGSWVEVVSAPRVGKSSGTLLGLMKWIVERGIDNYVVLVVVVNRRIGRQLYKYALGAWKRMLKDLRELGWNKGMLAERIRIRYYEGMESACLSNKKIHKFEDCLKCTLFQLYQKEWRKVYHFPVPVMDPVILRLSGYCPFQVLFSHVFWRNSFVIISYRMLPLVISILSRLSIRKVVIYFDEYLVHLNYRLVLKKIDISKMDKSILNLEVDYGGRKVKFSSVIYKYNSLIDEFIKDVFMYYDELGHHICKSIETKDREFLGLVFLDYIARVLRGETDLIGISSKVFNKFKEIVEVLDAFYNEYRLSVFRRFKRYIMYVFNSFFRSEYDGEEYSRKFAPEVVGSGIGSSFGGYVFSFMSFLAGLKKEIYIISSSVDDSNFSIESDISSVLGFRIIAPYSKLKYHRLSIVYNRGVIQYPVYPYKKDPDRIWNYVKSLMELFELLRGGKRSVAIVVDKESMMMLAKEFERLGWKIEYGRDYENPSIVDYIVVHRPNNSIILLFHPHGRTSMGVDPPYRDRIESVIVALGLRGYPRYVVPVPSVFRVIGREFDGKSVGTDDLPGMYCVVRNGFLYVYDVFSLKYDLHLMVQVIGRFFLSKSMKFVLLNPRYGIKEIKFFVLVHHIDVNKLGSVVGRIFKVSYMDKEGNEYTEYHLRLMKMTWNDVRMKLYEINVERFIKSDPSNYVLELHRVRYTMFSKLRNVYNSLRYVRKQLRYGRQPDRWWFAKKMVYLINGFEYVKWEKSPVPIGLKRAFEKYVNGGLEALLSYIYNRYLQGIDKEVWEFIKSYVYGFTRSWWWV